MRLIYIGGVDSMVLLHLLVQLGSRHETGDIRSAKKSHVSGLTSQVSASRRLVVAHFDHGIRPDSFKDRELVQVMAESYGLPFVFDEGQLGPKASEARAREARYKFLRKVLKASGANAIVTAHHQDDLLETAIINMLRGTGRKGLSSLQDQPDIKRPLLPFTKAEIIKYAQRHKLKWREDSTNQDTAYLRNFIRLKVIPNLTAKQKDGLLAHIGKVGELNREIDSIIENLVGRQAELDRQWFISLDHKVARDIMASWLRAHSVQDFDSKRLELLVRAAKTYQPGKRADIDKSHQLQIKKDKLVVTRTSTQ